MARTVVDGDLAMVLGQAARTRHGCPRSAAAVLVATLAAGRIAESGCSTTTSSASTGSASEEMIMSARSLFRLTAAGTMLRAVLFVAGVSQGAPPPKVAPLPQVLVLVFAVLLLAGLPALYLRQREECGVVGLVGAALVFVSVFLLAGMNYVWAFFVPGLAENAPAVLERFPGGEWQRLIALNVAARVGLAAGLALFGVATYRAGVLPRWTPVVAILGGVGAFVQIVVTLLELPEPVGMVVLLLPLGLFTLGWGLWSSVARLPEPATRRAEAARAS